MAPRLGMVAGEASGDLLAGLLMGGLKAHWPQLQAFGIGGPRMADHGFEAWWPHEKLAVRGYVEVLRHYRELVGIRNALGDRLLKERPSAFIGVDAPDFNLGLETRLKQQGIKTIHFISPSIWAWRGNRIERIRAAADHVLCIFPFEPELYAKHGIAATYVGHPLADAIPMQPPRDASRTQLGLSALEQVVALLPGSRRSEIEYNLPGMLQAAVLMKRERPALRFVLPAIPSHRALIDAMVAKHSATTLVEVLDGRSHEALAACDVTLIASGTATLEAALFKRPMVIAYNMHWITYQLMRRMAYQPWVGLPNILLRDFAVPELIQHEMTAQNLARAAFDWLDNPARCEALAQRFTQLHQDLRRNTALAATHAIEKVLET